MKKIFMAAMALVMAVFTSCSKDDVQLERNNELKVTFNVVDKAGFDADTRAVKTGWEAGDEVLIVMQGKEDAWRGEDLSYNYLKLRYNGTSWTINLTGLDKSLLESGKKYSAIYHPGTITVEKKYPASDEYYLTGYKGGEHLYNSSSSTYTYNASTSSIDLGTIELMRYSQDFQISVKELASAGKANGTWQMWIKDENDETASRIYYYPADNATLSDVGAFSTYSKNYSSGINYKGDVVFYFSNAGSDETSLKIELTDGTDTYTYPTTTIPAQGKAYTLPAITDAKWVK